MKVIKVEHRGNHMFLILTCRCEVEWSSGLDMVPNRYPCAIHTDPTKRDHNWVAKMHLDFEKAVSGRW